VGEREQVERQLKIVASQLRGLVSANCYSEKWQSQKADSEGWLYYFSKSKPKRFYDLDEEKDTQ